MYAPFRFLPTEMFVAIPCCARLLLCHAVPCNCLFHSLGLFMNESIHRSVHQPGENGDRVLGEHGCGRMPWHVSTLATETARGTVAGQAEWWSKRLIDYGSMGGGCLPYYLLESTSAMLHHHHSCIVKPIKGKHTCL